MSDKLKALASNKPSVWDQAEVPNAWEQLMVLRNLTKTTGILHDAQVVQLKYMPRVAISHSTGCEIEYTAKDIDEETGIVKSWPHLTFKVKVGKKKAPKDLKKRLNLMKEWVRQLLGDEFRVTVKIGAKTVLKADV